MSENDKVRKFAEKQLGRKIQDVLWTDFAWGTWNKAMIEAEKEASVSNTQGKSDE